MEPRSVGIFRGKLFLLVIISIFGTSLVYCQRHSVDRRFDLTRSLHAPITSSASSDTVFSVIGRWAWGPCKAVDAKGNYAYIGNGPTFQTLDVSNPSTPRIMSEIVTEALIADIRLRDTLAFVCNEMGLCIYNISIASTPRFVSSVTISGIPSRVAVVDSFVYVLTESGFVRVVDYSNLSVLRLRGGVAVNDEFSPCIAARGRFAYVGRRELHDVAVVNATNPDLPTTTELIVGGFTTSAFVRDTLLLLGMSPYRIKTYNISNPASPQFLGQVQLPGSTVSWGITATDSLAFVVAKDSGIYSIDISNLASPRVRGLLRRRILPSYQPTTMAAIGTRVYTAFYNGLLTVDATNPDTLRQRSFFATGGYAENVVVKDTIAFIASGYSGLWLVSIADPRRPKQISNINTGGYTCDVTVTDTLACIVNCDLGGPVPDADRGLWVINVSDLATPRALSHHIGIVKYSGTIPYNSISNEGNLVLITQQNRVGVDSVLEIIDLSNPRQPIRRGGLRTGYSPYYVAVEDSIAYLATPDSGLRIVDFHNPEAPRELSHILSSAIGVAVRSPYAYVMRESLFVVDVTNLHSPRVVGSTFTRVGNTSFRVSLSDRYLYWAYGLLGAVDVSSPTNPVQRTTFFGNSPATGVASSNRMVFLTEAFEGLLILENNLLTSVRDRATNLNPASVQLFQNFPNPANPQTSIQFQLPTRQIVTLELFDILGQKIVTLLNGEFEAGLHSMRFDGSHLSSGLYFYRLNANKLSIAKQLFIIK